MRLLAEANSDIKEHLINGPKNTKYTSKTVQNEILGIAANQIRDYYRSCLRKSPHFSIMADEVTSHGKEILAVCLRFLEIDHTNFQIKPQKHEVLLDFSFLTRITGKSIAEGILNVLEAHNIDIQNCQGQAYDTTASMSSSHSVQAHIKICIPSDDEELYDGTSWDWDAESRSTANGLLNTFTSFDHISAFTLTKEILEPLRPISESLQGRLQEVYFGFTKLDEVIRFYRQLRHNVE